MDAQKLALLILLMPGGILAVSLHEAMHGYVANMLGDPTAKIQGRLTLNPFKHIDLFGTILVPAMLFYMGGFLFGWAKPVPVNVFNLHRPKRDMALVAAAGPGANLVLAFIASILLYILALVINTIDISDSIMKMAFQPLFIILLLMLKFNIMLMFFNLIPIPPLDGGRILVGVLPQRHSESVAAIEPYGFFILIGLLVLNSYVPIFSYTLFPATEFLVRILVPGSLLGGV